MVGLQMDRAAPTSVKAIGNRLQATRQALGLSQAEICRLTGIAPNTWNQWERGVGRPELDKAFELCKTLGVTLDWIYRGNPGGLPFDLAQKVLKAPESRAS